MKDDAAYLRHILETIDRIELVAEDGMEAFVGNTIYQDAVLRNLHTMTETTQRLSASLKASYPEVEWSTLAAFRNVLVHDYLGIDIELIWTVITTDVPRFKGHVERIIGELG